MKIENYVDADLETIYDLYQDPRKIQVAREVVVWQHFDEITIEKEIQHKQQWNLLWTGK